MEDRLLDESYSWRGEGPTVVNTSWEEPTRTGIYELLIAAEEMESMDNPAVKKHLLIL